MRSSSRCYDRILKEYIRTRNVFPDLVLVEFRKPDIDQSRWYGGREFQNKLVWLGFRCWDGECHILSTCGVKSADSTLSAFRNPDKSFWVHSDSPRLATGSDGVVAE